MVLWLNLDFMIINYKNGVNGFANLVSFDTTQELTTQESLKNDDINFRALEEAFEELAPVYTRRTLDLDTREWKILTTATVIHGAELSKLFNEVHIHNF